MRDLFVRMHKAIRAIEQERGDFEIKCLVSRRADYILWDLVLVASWFEPSEKDRLRFLYERILSDLDIDLLIQFSAIITYPSGTENELTKLLSRVQKSVVAGHYQDPSGDEYSIIETQSEIARYVVPLVGSPSRVVNTP